MGALDIDRIASRNAQTLGQSRAQHHALIVALRLLVKPGAVRDFPP